MHTPVIPRALVACVLFCAASTIGAGTRSSCDSRWNTLLHRHVHDGVVDYAGFKSDADFPRVLKQFSATDAGAKTRSENRLAFWINAYNAFTIKLIVDHYPVKSIKEIESKPWNHPFIIINGQTYSLDQIEHEIIRKQFAESRIHFALVCAAKGCPPLRNEAYTGRSLDRQLEENARAFFGEHSKNRFDAAANVLYLSPMFDWYKNDFIVTAKTIQDYVRPFFPGAAITSQTKIQFTDYDWSLNGR